MAISPRGRHPACCEVTDDALLGFDQGFIEKCYDTAY